MHGILVQLPLPSHMDESKVVKAIDPAKDVDGFHPVNIGKLCIGGDGFDCCTPAGVIQLLKRSGISIRGRECVVVGRSNNVGKPTALLLLRENGTVTIAHSQNERFKGDYKASRHSCGGSRETKIYNERIYKRKCSRDRRRHSPK